MDRPNLQETLSHETLMSLEQLEPSPVESPDDLENRPPDLPPPPSSSQPFGFGRTGRGHGAVYLCGSSTSTSIDRADSQVTRFQRYSSYVFTIYTTFHITNTSIIPLITRSVPASERYLLLTRPYYQSPLMEPLIVTLPLLSHIASGLILRLHRRSDSLTRYGGSELTPSSRLASKTRVWPPISYAAISGYILTPLVFGHVFINRILPWWVEGGSSGVGLGFVSHGFAKHQVLSSVWYVAMVAITSGHIVWGWAKWMGWIPEGYGESGPNGKKGKKRRWIINGISSLVASLWMSGGLGVVGRGGKATGWVGKGWDDLYAKVPLLR